MTHFLAIRHWAISSFHHQSKRNRDMAGVAFKASTGSRAFSTATKTMLQIIAAANHRVDPLYFDVSCNGGLSTADTVLFEVLTQTDAGTGTSMTLQKYRSTDDETIQTTALRTHSAEPTPGNTLGSAFIHPYNGKARLGPFIVPGGTRVGIRVNTPAAGANCTIDPTGVE
jgi:hypothetical protein